MSTTDPRKFGPNAGTIMRLGIRLSEFGECRTFLGRSPGDVIHADVSVTAGARSIGRHRLRFTSYCDPDDTVG
jgi:hypothetical protein